MFSAYPTTVDEGSRVCNSERIEASCRVFDSRTTVVTDMIIREHHSVDPYVTQSVSHSSRRSERRVAVIISCWSQSCLEVQDGIIGLFEKWLDVAKRFGVIKTTVWTLGRSYLRHVLH